MDTSRKCPAWKRSVFKKATLWSGRVTVPSLALQKAMQVDHHFQGNFEVVPNVIDSSPPPEHVERPNIFTALTVADLHDHNKNVSGTLRMLAKVTEPFRFEIIGEGKDVVQLTQLARDLDLLDRNVFFLGRKTNEEVLRHLHEIDCLLVNSRFETFSMITAEALSAGTPVIATRCGGAGTVHSREKWNSDRQG